MKRFFLVGLLALLLLPVLAQEADWERAERFSEQHLSQYLKGKFIYPSWIEGSSYFYYNLSQDGVKRHYLVDAKTGKKKDLIRDRARFVQQYAAITQDTLDVNEIQIYGYEFKNNDFSRFYLEKKGKAMVYHINKGELQEIPLEKKETSRPSYKNPCHSSDSVYTILGCQHDLYLRYNPTGQIQRITFDGKPEAAYTYRNSKDTIPKNSKGFWLGHKFICFLHDQSEVEEISLIHSLGKGRPRTQTFKMPMPGDAGVRRYHLFYLDAATGQAKRLPIDKYADQEVTLDYFRSEDALFFSRKNRPANRIDLCRVNLADGSIDELISEESLPHLNVNLFNYKIIDQGKHIIWWSERTGKGNYYLYNSKGELLNRITQGENLVAAEIVHVDSLRRELIFAGYGQEAGINPYYRFYYKASLDGKKQELLTPGDGHHELFLSPDAKYAIDKYSRLDQLPHLRVLSVRQPKRNFKVDQVDDKELRAAGWKPPQLLQAKAADGKTDLYGVMYTPTNLDPNKKYPIISNVYPGPQDDQIPRAFSLDDNGNQSLAELGFVVITFGSRGSSPLRGRDFYCYSYGQLRDYPLADDKQVIEDLASRYSFIDLERVGIYGHSGGGFQAATALLTYPDFYQVAVAASGNYNNNIYIQWWGETFHGVKECKDPKTGQTRFEIDIPTTAQLAPRLAGKLLLITGDVDKNVPPSSTYQLADALIKANKRFDLFILPGKDHGVMSAYYQNLIRYYFVEHLLHPSSRHIDIINHK